MLLLFAAAGVAAGGCLAATTAGNEAARAWAEGPARWLLLPDERAALHRIATGSELTAFLQEFWRRRDDDPDTTDVPLTQLYAQRVADADRLYAEEGVRGSLTDRGGALLLLGPPSLLSFSARQVPAWESRRTPGPRPTRPVRLEIWTYQPRDLPPALRVLRTGGKAANGEVTLTFLLGPRTTRLIEGREVFAQAACAWARCAAPGS